MKPFFVIVVAISALAASGPTAPPAADQAIVHILNRAGFGPRAGDGERIRTIGIQRYIDEQLRPDRIPDTGINARLAGLETIRMSSRQIADEIERPQIEARRERQLQAKDDAPPSEPRMPDPLQQKANGVIVELSEQK